MHHILQKDTVLLTTSAILESEIPTDQEDYSKYILLAMNIMQWCNAVSNFWLHTDILQNSLGGGIPFKF